MKHIALIMAFTFAALAQIDSVIPIGGPIVTRILPSAGRAYFKSAAKCSLGVSDCTVAVNSLISIYGSGLGSYIGFGTYPWPLWLADTTVTIDGALCPLIFVGPSQINALVPAGLRPGTHRLTVLSHRGQDSTDLTLVPILPALFGMPAYPYYNLPLSVQTLCLPLPYCPAAAALNVYYTLITPFYPVAPGERIALFATGLGATTEINGYAYANASPDVELNFNPAEVPVQIFGAPPVPPPYPAVVTFAGRVPGYEGLDQINIQIPSNIPRRTNVPVTILGQPLPPVYVPCSNRPGTCWAPGGYTYMSNVVILSIN